MKQLSTPVASQLARKQGVEIVLYIGVEWADGSETFYSSTEVEGCIKSVVSMSGLETTTRLQGGSSQSVTVELSDTGGDLTNILNTVDVHKRPAKVYLSFPGVPVDQAVVLIDGEINSEIKWNDSTRSLTFSILSKIESNRFGFAAEDGLFASVDPSRLTTPWPFRFGFTCSRPTVKIGNGVKGFLRKPQGVVDPSLDAKICQAQQIKCPSILSQNIDGSYGKGGTDATKLFQVRNSDLIVPGYERVGPIPDGGSLQNYFTGFKCNGATTQVIVTAVSDIPFGYGQPDYDPEVFGYQFLKGKCIGDYDEDEKNCAKDRFAALCQYLRQRSEQQFWAKPTLTIAGGDDFPQGRLVTILVGDILYKGTFSGEIFTITKTTDPGALNAQLCKQIPPYARGYRPSTSTLPNSLAACEATPAEYELKIVGGAGEAFRALDEIESKGFIWLPSGTEVTLQESGIEVHIVSLTPGSVDQVMAYRKVGDIDILTQVPPSYYEVVTIDYGDLSAVEVHLDRPLSTYENEDWSSELYVTFTSSISANPADVIQWIAERYTDLTVDAGSFAQAQTKLGRYPCNYYYASRENALSVLNKIAYEARCALIVSDNVLKIIYLPDEPSSIRTLTSSDVVASSFYYDHTGTESLVTSSRVTWQDVGTGSIKSDTVQNFFTVENNVDKYGYIPSTDSYVTVTNKDQALKTATFWSIRDSNTWRLARLKVGLENLDLDTYDCVTLDIPSFPNVKCLVERVAFDPTSGVIDLDLWTPVLSGTTEQYLFAWPAGNNKAIPYPLNNEDLPAPRVSLTPPVGSPLYIETPGGKAAATRGDRFPSDTGDVLPFNECRETSDPSVIEVIQPQFEEIDLQGAASRADQVAAQNYQANVGINYSSEDDEDLEDENEDPNLCKFEVRIQYGLATSIGESDGGSGFDCLTLPGPCKQEGTGTKCSGPNFFRTETFGNREAALVKVIIIRGLIEQGYCSWQMGKIGPVSVSGPWQVSGGNCSEINGLVSTRFNSPEDAGIAGEAGF